MHKFLLPLVMMLLPLLAKAEYTTLTFVLSDGQNVTTSLTDLRIGFTDTELIAVSEGGQYNIALDKLMALEYSDATPDQGSEPNPDDDPNNNTGGDDPNQGDDPDVSVAQFTVDQAVNAYSAAGLSLGQFDSVAAATAKLPAGTYIFTNKSGQTLKIQIIK